MSLCDEADEQHVPVQSYENIKFAKSDFLLDYISSDYSQLNDQSQPKIHFTVTIFKNLTDGIDSTCAKDQNNDIIGNWGKFDLYAYFFKQLKVTFANVCLIYWHWVTYDQGDKDTQHTTYSVFSECYCME